LNQKEQTIIKYQDLLKLAREEVTKLNKQHEMEINNLMDKLNITRDSNLQKIKENLKFTPRSDRISTKSEVELYTLFFNDSTCKLLLKKKVDAITRT
jgi:hypothetical protein